MTTGGDTVVLSQNGSALISAVTDNNNGTYSAFISNTTAETVIISGTIEGSSIGNTESVTFTVLPANAANTLMSVSTATVAADGTSTSTITIQAKDLLGNNITTGGETVALLQTGSALISTVTDNNDGTYTAIITNTTAETVTISGTIAGSSLGNTQSVTFTVLPTNAANSTIAVSASSVEADGTSSSTITVQAKDLLNNNVTTGGDTEFFLKRVVQQSPQ